MTLKKGTDKGNREEILEQQRSQKKSVKGIDAHIYCGVITLKESPGKIQKRLRSEWD